MPTPRRNSWRENAHIRRNGGTPRRNWTRRWQRWRIRSANWKKPRKNWTGRLCVWLTPRKRSEKARTGIMTDAHPWRSPEKSTKRKEPGPRRTLRKKSRRWQRRGSRRRAPSKRWKLPGPGRSSGSTQSCRRRKPPWRCSCSSRNWMRRHGQPLRRSWNRSAEGSTE